MNLQPVSHLQARPLDWLWTGRRAFGKLAILDGDPDLGKSLITLDLCARLSTGRPLPDGSTGTGPESCLLLCAEDSAADTIRPRLEALAADLERIYIWPREETGLPRFPSQIKDLDETLKHSHARLVVIDPVMSFLDRNIAASNDQSVRRLLDALLRCAEEHRCVILLVRHLNKKAGGPALYRGSSSIAFNAACRFAWLAARDPESPDQCVLAQVRNSQAAPQPSLAYKLQSASAQSGNVAQDFQPDGAAEPASGNSPTGPPRLVWLGPSNASADDLLARRRLGRLPRALARAKEFLNAFLEDGPRTSRALWQAVDKRGLCRKTVRTAKTALDVRTEFVGHGGRLLRYWLLPHQQLPTNVRPTDQFSLDPWLKPFEDEIAGRVSTPVGEADDGRQVS
jgi:hypothetical protein